MVLFRQAGHSIQTIQFLDAFLQGNFEIFFLLHQSTAAKKWSLIAYIIWAIIVHSNRIYIKN